MQIEWAPYPTDNRYLISSEGEVYSTISEKVLAPVQVKDYLKIWIVGKVRFVHNLVLEAFVGPRPNGDICRHLDGQTWNNSLFNLQWGTHKENVQDSREHGTFRKLAGPECGQSKLTRRQVIEIRRRYAAGGITQGRLAKEYGICQARISAIVNFKTYRNVKGAK